MTTTSDAWAVVAAALGSSLLTTVGAGWRDRVRSRREQEGGKNAELRRSCEQLVGAASQLAYRASALFRMLHLRSGLAEGFDVVLRYRKPLELLEVTDWLLQDIGPVLQAQTVIWNLGSGRLIEQAGDSVLAVQSVIQASSHLTEAQRPKPIRSWRFLSEIKRRLTPLRVEPESEAALTDAIAELGRTLRRLAQTMREELGTPDPEALLRAYPIPAGQDDDRRNGK